MPSGSSADVRPTANHPVVVGLWTSLFALCISQAGCTALLTASALRDTVHESTEATAVGVRRGTPDDAATVAEANAVDDADDDQDAAGPVLVKPGKSAEQALEAAIERLANADRLDDATQAALLGMLEQAPKQDWPEIIDAFVDAIETSHVAAKPVAAPPQAEPAPATEPPITIVDSQPPAAQLPPAAAQPPSLSAAPPPPATVEPLVFPVEPAAAIVASPPPTAAPAVAFLEPEPARPALTLANPCFAMRVRGWGLVDQFQTSRFQPGQEVIVYFELDHLESRESAEGHTTRIDTALSLCADDGRTLHKWTFEPVEETCPARRRDYFARYVVRVPEKVPAGAWRLEIAVSDEIGGRTAQTHLPLEISPQ